MTIKASSTHQIDTLIADLGAGDLKREAAIARLTVIGARAVGRLITFVDGATDPMARAAAFRALEAIGDRRATDRAIRASGDPDATVAVAAIGAARVFLRGPHSAAIVDALTTAAMDRDRPEPVRLSALSVLMELEEATIAPLLKELATDPNPAVRQAVVPALPGAPRQKGREKPDDATSSGLLAHAADNGLPADPQELRDIIIAAGQTAPLPTLLRIVEMVRDREAKEPALRRREWTRTRAAAHLALANRGSRLALYDLRESLEAAAAPLPVEFLAALTLVGDVACLEPIAAAYTHTPSTRKEPNDWWRQHLADAFQAIAARAKVTRRHAAIRKIETRWPGTLGALWAGGR